jgi:hypothetical protein
VAACAAGPAAASIATAARPGTITDERIDLGVEMQLAGTANTVPRLTVRCKGASQM